MRLTINNTAFSLLIILCIYTQLCSSLCTYKAPSNPQDRRPDTNTLRVATYNAEWLFLANDEEPNSCPPAGCQYPTLASAMSHIKAVAQELIDINADIVVLEEVEGCDTLDTLNAEIGLSFGYKPYLIVGKDTYTGQNVGILTRVDPIVDLERTNQYFSFPVPGNNCGASDSGEEGVSKNLYTAFRVNDTVVHIFGVHFLAYPTDKVRCLEREAQASVIAAYMQEKVMYPTEQVIVLGDFNDYAPNMPDAANSKPISRVLNFLYDGLVELYDDTLVNIGTLDTQSQRYSSWWDQNGDCKSESGELTAIDHLLVSPALFNQITTAEYYHNYAATCNTAVSDHYAVVATFTFQCNLLENSYLCCD